LLHRLGFALLNMGVVAIQNSVTPKTRFIGKLLTKNQVDFESPTLAGECNRLVAMLAPAEHDRGKTPAL
jgi:hypothetical protein